MPSKLLRMLLCCHHHDHDHDEPFLHANRPITVATLAVTSSPASSTRRSPPPSTRRPLPPPSSSPPASIRPAPPHRRHPSSHYPSSSYSRETSSLGPAAGGYPSWFTKSDTVRKMALGPWHPDNLRVEFAAGCRAGAKGPGRSIYTLPKRG